MAFVSSQSRVRRIRKRRQQQGPAGTASASDSDSNRVVNRMNSKQLQQQQQQQPEPHVLTPSLVFAALGIALVLWIMTAVYMLNQTTGNGNGIGIGIGIGNGNSNNNNNNLGGISFPGGGGGGGGADINFKPMFTNGQHAEDYLPPPPRRPLQYTTDDAGQKQQQREPPRQDQQQQQQQQQQQPNHQNLRANNALSQPDEGGGGGRVKEAAAAVDEDVEEEEDEEGEDLAPPPPKIVPSSTTVIDMRQVAKNLPFENTNGGVWTQGWNVTPRAYGKDDPLQIFVVPHSHCDPGWIKTFDEYFQSQTKKILTTIYNALMKDKNRTFIWAEISYFEWWYREQNDVVKAGVKNLLKRKQLEFVTGGWVQPDEANTQLYAMEVQLQEGHDWIERTFGKRYVPKFGWSIDPFGYSPTMAYLLNKYGFKGMLIQRVHYAVKKELARKKHLEFLWRQTWDNEGSSDIFTHVMPFFSYDAPHSCGPDPSICCQFDFARIDAYGKCPWKKPVQVITPQNVHERSLTLIDQYQKKAALYQSNAVLIPLGDDFRYQSEKEAERQYTNYQKIMDHVNSNNHHDNNNNANNFTGVTMKFGTLSEYFRAVMGHFQPPVLKGSFFTYSDREQDYWSGYFTSRVFDKALDRVLERTLYAAADMGADKRTVLQKPRRALSLFQHHDGVTGTAKTKVVEDYAKQIHDAINVTQYWMLDRIQQENKDLLLLLLEKSKSNGKSSNDDKQSMLQPCWMSTAPRGLSQNLCRDDRPVVLYNPLDTPQRCGDVVVQGHETATGSLPCETPGPLSSSSSLWSSTTTTEVTFDPVTGLMTYPFREEWMVWNVDKGGAYLFFPGELFPYDNTGVKIEFGGFQISTPQWKRTIVEKQIFPASSSSSYRKSSSSKSSSKSKSITVFDFIFVTDLKNSNQEWFVRFSPSGKNVVNNTGIFHTDLNGFNFDTHYFRKDMPIQSQVFPMPTLASIEDEKRRFTVLSQHAQGTASLENGSIDVWLDRRLKQDDSRGLFQGVLDNVPTRTRLRVLLEEQQQQQQKQQQHNDNNKNALKTTTTTTTTKGGEFAITEACQLMWNELNHPLEMFGIHTEAALKEAAKKKPKEQPIVPFVYMVRNNRVDHLKIALDSLLASDFPAHKVPIVINLDGHMSEIMTYTVNLKQQFPLIQTRVHPHSCHDHTTDFPGPGADAELNRAYSGDILGHKRRGSDTLLCAKHHFAWMMSQVWKLDNFVSVENSQEIRVDAMLFLDHDHYVAPTVYQSVVNGLELLEQQEDNSNNDMWGVALDTTGGRRDFPPFQPKEPQGWMVKDMFAGGAGVPIVLPRASWRKLQTNHQHFCTFDDHSWEHTILALQSQKILPSKVLVPTAPQALRLNDELLQKKLEAERKKKEEEQRKQQGAGKAAEANKKPQEISKEHKKAMEEAQKKAVLGRLQQQQQQQQQQHHRKLVSVVENSNNEKKDDVHHKEQDQQQQPQPQPQPQPHENKFNPLGGFANLFGFGDAADDDNDEKEKEEQEKARLEEEQLILHGGLEGLKHADEKNKKQKEEEAAIKKKNNPPPRPGATTVKRNRARNNKNAFAQRQAPPLHSAEIVDDGRGRGRATKQNVKVDANGGWGHPKDQQHCLDMLSKAY